MSHTFAEPKRNQSSCEKEEAASAGCRAESIKDTKDETIPVPGPSSRTPRPGKKDV